MWQVPEDRDTSWHSGVLSSCRLRQARLEELSSNTATVQHDQQEQVPTRRCICGPPYSLVFGIACAVKIQQHMSPDQTTLHILPKVVPEELHVSEGLSGVLPGYSSCPQTTGSMLHRSCATYDFRFHSYLKVVIAQSQSQIAFGTRSRAQVHTQELKRLRQETWPGCPLTLTL